ncbi:MAG: (2Fe-2S) ferredoxin domain-containing protein [Candidatus Omnitrophica bacterium]|nr:(2Fe-2S) ferredoxin domain-containing protein [Candidatus Omnitrophota bacterium]MBU1996041.1 (2Fe-2S) ferredoxin domain-containing protein [Candidatus Omnitrophota bacterium]MBU4334439.1 (2Fe-2S) ferredoxin domain-containing protein [Candidatus Omnitrophota bacterium]
MKLTLNNFDEETKNVKKNNKNWIKVGLSTCGIAAGADVAFATIKKVLQENGSDVEVIRTGCAGKCYAEPLVEVKIEGMPQVVYGNVNEEVATKIVQKHVMGKQLINDHIYLVKDA